MSRLADIVSALATDAANLQQDHWAHIPLDEHLELRLIRASDGHGVAAIVAQRPTHRTETEEEAALCALLRIGADTRWTDALHGGIDESGWDCIALSLDDPSDSARVEAVLRRAIGVLADISAPCMAVQPVNGTRGLP